MPIRSSPICPKSLLSGESDFQALLRRGVEYRLAQTSEHLDLVSIFPSSDSDIAVRLEQAIRPGNGLVVIGAPTFNGKETTYNALVRHLISTGRQVGGVEDTHRVLQFRYPELARLDMDPRFPVSDSDVILADELRISQDCWEAFRAAEGWGNTHQSTLGGNPTLAMAHLSRAAHFFQRIAAMGNELDRDFSLVRFILCQLLVKKLCATCSFGGEPRGCDECTDGYSGKAVLAETIDLRGRDITGLSKNDLGMLEADRSFDEHAAALIANKVTTQAEIRRVLGREADPELVELGAVVAGGAVA